MQINFKPFLNFLQFKIKKNISAFSTLETTMILPAVGLLIFGAVDVTRVLQAYSALQEGVETSLRCAYTTDGECTKANVSTSSAKFNVFTAETQTQWYQPQTRYTARVSWLEVPRTQLEDFRPRIIGSLNYYIPPREYLVSRQIPVSSVQYNYYLQQAQGPYVVNGDTGNERANASQSLRFVYGNRSGFDNVDYPRFTRNISRTLKLEIGQRSAELKIRNVKIPDLQAEHDIPCYRANSFNRWISPQNRRTNYANTCSQDWVPFAFHLTGTQVGRNGGRVLLSISPALDADQYLRYTRGENVRGDLVDLGGQILSDRSPEQDNSASFVPRGVNNWSNDNGYVEYQKYSRLYVKPGAELTIHLELQEPDGQISKSEIGWRAEQLTYFLPDTNFIDPGTRLNCEAATNVENCQVVYPNSSVKIPEIAKKAYQVESPKIEQRSLGCKVKNSIEALAAFAQVGWPNCESCTIEPSKDNKACLNQTLNLGIKKEINCESNCDYDVQNKNCKNAANLEDLNPGVAGDPNQSGSKAQQEAKQICSIPESDLDGYSYRDLNAVYHEIELNFPEEKFIYERDSCLKPVQPTADYLPSKYSRFNKYYFAKNLKSTRKLGTGGLDPKEFKRNVEYACLEEAGLFFGSTVEGNLIPENLPSDSMFRSIENKYCDCEQSAKTRFTSDSAYKKYFADADQDLFIDFNCVETSPIIVSTYPTNVCPEPVPNVQASSDWTLYPGGPYKQDQLPGICKDKSHTCKLALLNYEMTGSGSESNLDISAASAHGYQAFEAIIPWAKQNCSEADCIRLAVEDQGQQVKVRAEIDLQLRTLLNRPIRLNYESSRIYESILSGINRAKIDN